MNRTFRAGARSMLAEPIRVDTTVTKKSLAVTTKRIWVAWLIT